MKKHLNQSDHNSAILTGEIKKLYLEEIILFATNHIPEVDSTTLERFLELVNAGGTFGTISHKQVVWRMNQVLKYTPDGCIRSLVILLDLLGIDSSDKFTHNAGQTERAQPNTGGHKAGPFFIDISNIRKEPDSTKRIKETIPQLS